LVVSPLSLHAVNDLPGTLAQIRRCLKPDGLFLGLLFGGQTLRELRDVLTAAEMEITGGLTPRIFPFVDIRDAGDLLARAGFALPVVDGEVLDVSYEHLFSLMADLRGMGESNILHQRQKHLSSRRIFLRAAELYHTRYANEEGRIPASFELVTLTAWAPHANQQQPAKRGSGKMNLGDALR
ncbi:MAG: SAM-dependent methyltransferase, partial [Rickettsiales bacterium]